MFALIFHATLLKSRDDLRTKRETIRAILSHSLRGKQGVRAGRIKYTEAKVTRLQRRRRETLSGRAGGQACARELHS